ncbi:DUF3237 family protein [Alkalitalea saponilacus]|uniref:Uncharacterized protein n=1 Tax=Alkalitalea saponilacus TaxID=889453 RepID=A0A1T5ACN4_9BACT|nr:DUF3237 family protein [Alkalitalea saponilacus]ASB48750.1 hypothetical protein CDL62_06170 [Alkalitalea saponilacus]SKB32771.1 Protein of unknown function [Alkalitalea saponilacus]
MTVLSKSIGMLFLTGLFMNGLSAQENDDSHEIIYKSFKTELVWEAKVKIGEMINLGESKRGVRRIIPILGGTFSGTNINGVVLPMGEDWQLVRPDGDTELYARYLLKTDDGYIIQVINKVLMHEGSQLYSKSVIDLEAPINSPYEYLNHAIFIGTLGFPDLKEDEDPYVIIGVYKLL